MKFQLYSDVHLEIDASLKLQGGENLLLAGDIMVARVFRDNKSDARSRSMKKGFQKFINEECSKYKNVFYIVGNHEYYEDIWQDTIPLLRRAMEGTNVRVMDNEFVHLDEEITLWGGTMWTSFRESLAHRMAAASYMNDYNLIGNAETGNLITTDFIQRQNAISFNQLRLDVEANKGRKLLVMTHHAPTRKSTHPRYENDHLINAAYMNDYDNFIAYNPDIKVWVHGHTHDTHQYTIDTTRVYCNPRGYVWNGIPENRYFENPFEFEIV